MIVRKAPDVYVALVQFGNDICPFVELLSAVNADVRIFVVGNILAIAKPAYVGEICSRQIEFWHRNAVYENEGNAMFAQQLKEPVLEPPTMPHFDGIAQGFGERVEKFIKQ